jgi:hypothetical protein
MKKLAAGLTYANVMATVAVFLALGGGAYAALKLPKNSVGATQIKSGSVNASKLAPGSVTLSKLAADSVGSLNLLDGSVSFGKLAPNSVDGTKVVDNSLGGADVNEATLGPVPSAGTADALSRVDYESASGPVPAASASTTVTAVCPVGFVAVGGGGKVSDPTKAGLDDSYPEGRSGWTARAFNAPGAPVTTLTTYVICVVASATTP